jgi:hypothetical protein
VRARDRSGVGHKACAGHDASMRHGACTGNGATQPPREAGATGTTFRTSEDLDILKRIRCRRRQKKSYLRQSYSLYILPPSKKKNAILAKCYVLEF